MRSLSIHAAYVLCFFLLTSCATQPPDVDDYLDGTITTAELGNKSALPDMGVHKIALVVRERDRAAFDYYGFGDSHLSYAVPQSGLVPERYLRDQMIAAFKQQSELQVVDRSEYAEEFVLATTFQSYVDGYQVNQDTPAYSQLQSMHAEGIDAVMLIVEHDNNPFNLWGSGSVERYVRTVGPKGMCFCPPATRSDEKMIAYDDFTAILISTSDGKEIDGRHYHMGSYAILNIPWQAEYSAYSPQTLVLMQEAVQEREHSNALQILRTFKILPALPSPFH